MPTKSPHFKKIKLLINWSNVLLLIITSFSLFIYVISIDYKINVFLSIILVLGGFYVTGLSNQIMAFSSGRPGWRGWLHIFPILGIAITILGLKNISVYLVYIFLIGSIVLGVLFSNDKWALFLLILVTGIVLTRI